jgi:hypothetical protein
MPGNLREKLREILECFYEKHVDKVAWVLAAAIWTLIVTHGELWRWRWTTVDPVIAHLLSDHDRRDSQLDAIESRLRVIEAEVSRIEGHLDAEKKRKRYDWGGL